VDRCAPIVAAMTRRALTLATAAAIAALVLAACTSGGATPSASSRVAALPLEGTAWQLTDYLGPGAASLPVPEAVAATATFASGKVTGNAGCNTYNATYALDGDKLTIGTPAMTAMACPEPQMALEKAYTAALEKVATYQVSGDTLELKTAEGKVGLRYAAAVAPALTKTRWVATTINNGKSATVSVVAGSTVTAIFAEDGTVAGSGGCNDYHGTYTVDGAALDFGPLGSTKMACADEAIATQEAAYFAALAKVATFAINGGNLELRATDGSLQAGYRATQP
jgi:heat shock protein HslJ